MHSSTNSFGFPGKTSILPPFLVRVIGGPVCSARAFRYGLPTSKSTGTQKTNGPRSGGERYERSKIDFFFKRVLNFGLTEYCKLQPKGSWRVSRRRVLWARYKITDLGSNGIHDLGGRNGGSWLEGYMGWYSVMARSIGCPTSQGSVWHTNDGNRRLQARDIAAGTEVNFFVCFSGVAPGNWTNGRRLPENQVE